MRVLIFGASGFIGAHLSQSLAMAGAQVHCASRSLQSSSISRSGQPGSLTVTCDVTDKQQVKRVVARTRPQLIFNLACARRRELDIDEFRSQMNTTAGGVMNIAEAIGGEQPEALLVHLGSSEEYGDSDVPFLESHPDNPSSAYSVAKCAATRFLLAAKRAMNLRVIVARPSVVFGPGQKSDMFIPYAIAHYCGGQMPDLTPGEQTRDFIYIDDLVDGLLTAGMHPELSGEIFNFSSGKSLPLRDVARLVAELCHYRGELGIGKRPYRRAEVMKHCASWQKAADMLGWRPQVDFEKGLERTVSWWQGELKST